MAGKKPLRGIQLVIFSVLFAGVMLFLGYKLLFKSNDATSLERLNTQVSEQQGKALFDKAFDYYTKGDYANAANLFKASADKGYQVSYALLGECELHMKNLQPAETYMLKALAVKNGEEYLTGYYSGIEFNLGLLYYIKNNRSLAMEHFTKAKNLGNKNAGKYLNKLMETVR